MIEVTTLIEQLGDYIVFPVVVMCLVIGYCIKHIKWLDAIANEYIPIILTICGIIIMCALKWGELNVMAIIYGAFSGCISTGLHQIFKGIVERNTTKEDNKNGF